MAVKDAQVSVRVVRSEIKEGPERQYRPLSTKSWILVLYILAMLACFTVLQALQIRGEPFTELGNTKRHVPNDVHVYRRQNVSVSTTTSSSRIPDQTSTLTEAPNRSSQLTLTTKTTSSSNPDPTYPTITVGKPAPNQQLTLTTSSSEPTSRSTTTNGSGPIVESSPIAVSQMTLTSQSTAVTTAVMTMATTAITSKQSQSTVQPVAVSSPQASGQLSLTSQPVGTSSTLAVGQSSEVTPLPASLYTSSPSTLNSQAQVIETRVSSTYVTGSDGRSSLTVVTITTSSQRSLSAASASQLTSTNKQSQTTYLVNSNGKVTGTSTIPMTSSTTARQSQTTYLIDNNGKVTGTSTILMTSSTAARQYQTTYLTDSAGQVTGTSTAPVVVSTVPAGRPAVASQLAVTGTFKEADYFLALYLPKMTAVVLQSLWSVTYAATKLMEPFYQLASIEGASAKHSLLTEYLASGVKLDSITSIFEGRYVLGLSSLTYLLMSIMVALVSESMTVEPTAYCKTEISDSQPCDPAWVINLPIAHTVQAMLIILCLTIAGMVVLNHRRRSGIESDPSRLAALAKLLGNRTFMNELQNIRPLADLAEVRNALRGNVYRLDSYDTATGYRNYGITQTSAQVSSGEDFIQSEIGYMAVQNPNTSARTKVKPRNNTSKTIQNFVLLALVTSLFAIILAYRLISDPGNLFNIFMNSEGFGPRFVLSGAAVVIGFGIKGVEHEIRVMETYRHMSQTPQPAERSVLTSLSQTTYTNLYIGMQRGQWFASFTAFVTICSDILVIAVSGIPQSASQIADAYEACTFVSLGILALMIATIISVMVRRASNPDMPRNPDTLANTLLYLCGSNMVEQHEKHDGSSDLGQRQLDHDHNGKRFDFRWASGMDGKTRWTVNEVPYNNRY